ncbi:hypothetical protein B7463_g3563, partial [Scytalidium lignicola]
MESQQEKYRLWSRNISATQDGHLPTSLEYRIREDPTAQRNINQVLDYLVEDLESISKILRGVTPNGTWIGELPLSHEKQEALEDYSSSDIKELLYSIRDRISDLFRLSIVIRGKPATDEYAKAALRYPHFNCTTDLVHVRDKYPEATGETWLLDRLGLAITRRRQFLLYRKNHQQRLEEVHNLKYGSDGKTIWSGTKASTHLLASKEWETFAFEDKNTTHNVRYSTRPMTEYADSSRGTDGATNKLRTPPLPLNDNGIRVEYGEMKHILSDLRPYVCTDIECELNMFESQHDWFEHEVKFHRKLWECKLCTDGLPRSKPELYSHLQDHHAGSDESNDTQKVESWQKFRIDATECPLCCEFARKLKTANNSQKCDVALKQFQSHLGGHFEQLAFVALPNDENLSCDLSTIIDDVEGVTEISEDLSSDDERQQGHQGHQGPPGPPPPPPPPPPPGYSVYTIRKVPSSNPKEKATWMRVERVKESLFHDVITSRIKKLDEQMDKYRDIAEKKASLHPNQQDQITRLLDDLMRNEQDQNFEWSLAQLEIKEGVLKEKGRKDKRETKSITLYVKRSLIPGANAPAIYHFLES